MRRRKFLATGLAATGSAAVSACFGRQTAQPDVAVRTISRAAIDNAGGLYFPHRAPLQPGAFQKLPPGSIAPKGWLRHQLDLQLDGLNGRMAEISDYLQYDNCGWVEPAKKAWEEMPYWLRGFGDLGYVTGDERVLQTSRKWIDAILATQQPDGWFGPERLRTSLEGGPDFWPGMPLLDALRSFQEYTDDPRVVPFLTRYFQFQNTQPAPVFKRGWGNWRWGDNIDSVYWIYNRTGEPWLLDLVRKMHENSADYTGGIPTWHNVNIAQGFREPAQYGVLAKDPRFQSATYRNYQTVMDRYGQFPGGGFAGDENCRPGYGDPRQGFETCGIVEFMHSFEMLTRITGDPVWADRSEELAFNSMPAAFDLEQKGTHYVTCANSIRLDNTPKKHHQFDNDFAMGPYMAGIHNYRCCPHNYGMGWPYYAEEMWLATPDRGLCASLYGACEVKAKAGDGTLVRIVEETEYPFGDTVRFRIEAPNDVAFPLYLRVPRWCGRPNIALNGRKLDVAAGPTSYVIIDRTWKTGDAVQLQLPMKTDIRTWEKNHGSISVNHGPLTFSLAIQEDWKKSGTDKWPEYEVFPASPWNYGLVLDRKHPERSFTLQKKSGAVPANPFTPDNVPVSLRVKARKINAWQADSENVVGLLQQSPAKSSEPVGTVMLIPMGAARLRISAFPTVETGTHASEWVLPQAPGDLPKQS
jgi:hypothetical protein